MRQILWDTVKVNAIAEFGYPFYQAGPAIEGSAPYALLISLENHKHWRENLKILEDAGCELIKNWDIRRASVLRELFPHCMPKGYITPDYDDKGRWVLIFN